VLRETFHRSSTGVQPETARKNEFVVHRTAARVVLAGKEAFEEMVETWPFGSRVVEDAFVQRDGRLDAFDASSRLGACRR
jgi:hypothetical protein